MKLEPILQETLADCTAVAAALGIDVANADGGKTGLKTMYGIFDVACRNRSYDDSHPGFAGGQWERILPYTGRDYCWYYKAFDCDDSHLATLLKRVKQAMMQPKSVAIQNATY